MWNPKGYMMLQSDVMRAAKSLEENNIANPMNRSNGCWFAGDVDMTIFVCLQRQVKNQVGFKNQITKKVVLYGQ
jgi:hypothetical protein